MVLDAPDSSPSPSPMPSLDDNGPARSAAELNRETLTGSGRQLRGAKGTGSVSLVEQISDPDDVLKTVLARAKYAADYRRPFEEEWHRSVMAMFQVLVTDMEGN